jgi:hypothetical protein
MISLSLLVLYSFEGSPLIEAIVATSGRQSAPCSTSRRIQSNTLLTSPFVESLFLKNESKVPNPGARSSDQAPKIRRFPYRSAGHQAPAGNQSPPLTWQMPRSKASPTNRCEFSPETFRGDVGNVGLGPTGGKSTASS